MSYPNEASIDINTNGMYYYGHGEVTKVTSITREFDEEGRLVKETETVTEYKKSQPVPYSPYRYQPNPWISGMKTDVKTYTYN